MLEKKGSKNMEKKIENLKFILARLDTYIESTQNKSNLYLVLNTIILGGVITIISVLKDLNCSWYLIVLLAIIAMASILSIIITLFVINPYIKNSIEKEKSIFFFNDIASCSVLTNYEKLIEDNDDTKFVHDLCSQIYSIAKGLNSKYNKLKIVGYTIVGEFFLLAIWIVTFLITK